eukprot:759198-Rhodomonas_salina.1
MDESFTQKVKFYYSNLPKESQYVNHLIKRVKSKQDSPEQKHWLHILQDYGKDNIIDIDTLHRIQLQIQFLPTRKQPGDAMKRIQEFFQKRNRAASAPDLSAVTSTKSPRAHIPSHHAP